MTKLLSTIHIVSCLFMARTFGTYHISYDGPNQAPRARYAWRGRMWDVPTGPVS